MLLQTDVPLTEEVISLLQDLIQLNLDSRDGFCMASAKIDDQQLRDVFDFFARQRELQANELAKFVMRTGERPRKEGTYRAILHRIWAEMRTLLSRDDRLAMLEEAEQSEEAVQLAYEEALSTMPDGWVRDVLQEQCDHVKAGHSRIRDLRHEHRGEC